MPGSGTTQDAVTAAPQGRRAEEAPPQRSSGVVWGVVGAVAGAVVATIATWALLSGELGLFARWLDSVLNLLLAALAGAGVTAVLAVLVVWWWWPRFVGMAQGTFGQVVSNVRAAAWAAAENDAAAAVSHAERAVHEAAAWYAPIAARRFVVQTLITLLVTFGGLVGTGLLFRQTLLLGAQNAKLDLQTVTAEAQRRGGLAAELFSILQAVSQLTPSEKKGGSAGRRRCGCHPD
jgi:hypothetical protein